MASFSRSFKPPSYFRPRRPNRTSRKSNNPSEASSPASSAASLSESDEEQFVLSGANTPVTENAPPSGSGLFGATAAGRGTIPTKDRSQPTGNVSRSLDTPRLAARPIAIELPALRKINTAPVYTPPEPLSARGERPGGYFPLHEDPKSRVHHPHPFQLDIKKARNNSINLAVEAASPETNLGIPPVSVTMADNVHYPLFDGADSSRSSSTNTPVTSYLPSGVHETPLPMGKYYPSNYENRQNLSSSQNLRPPTSAPAPTPGNVKSDSQVPRYRGDPKHSRTDSEAKRRLQQYQRDMIAQATLAARQVLGGTVKQSGSRAGAPSTGGVSLHNIHLGASLMHKPLSPKLMPLGSPGPVTPMDLEGEGDSYLSRGRPMSGPDADRETEEVARAMRMEEERRRREGATSPAIELGPVTF
ncbi:uncharacterized protein E0L32_011904 [Thyridium curvatum]|uniref:Uncharacterized protein n=1 Tax=Thyridium curvatum TaxID=1093900 RepID=A0A507BMN9_9PEZI|nr:uncharacterized protein E0L32_011904 [Thyridium curvatum]TPX18038.1 hypothetical protein E0L32_011904 [Thyridium curvatum]